MKAIVCSRFGDPEEVLEVRDVPVPEPGPGQVRVRMIASPINPSDLLYVRGQYGRLPPLPLTPGFEGVGVVEKAGPGLLARRVLGRRVAVLNSSSGNWQERVVIPARQAVPVPRDLPDEQAAMFFVNPASALVMTRYVLRVPAGAWLLQTAAGSALGRMVIALGRHYGFRTINVVRRREQAEELLRAGGDAVVCTADESITDRVRQLTDGEGVPFALDAVGGETGSAVVRSLGANGRMLVYGTLSEKPLEVHPRVLMVGQKRVEGFWLAEWVRGQGILTMLGLFRRLGKLMRAGVLRAEVGAMFPLEEIKAAVRQASAPGRAGKVLLRLGPG
ncbi:MAG TPA: zinc-dependent alcohol dehydrogenase family protein [Gemmataceae bacterium]|nr:zinc-dependent alcohol dehydrogenase family protein [Gemmataceae bacterium]